MKRLLRCATICLALAAASPLAALEPEEPVVDQVLRQNTTDKPIVDYYSVVVVQSAAAGDRYCLVPPFGRNPFAAASLEKTNVRLYDSIVDLAKAVRELPPNIRVTVGAPRVYQPSRHTLRPLSRSEFDDICGRLKAAPPGDGKGKADGQQ
jgi:hypothetical protein